MEFSEIIKTPIIEQVSLIQPKLNSLKGTLSITTYYLIFSSRKNETDELWLLHSMIDVVEKKLYSINNNGLDQFTNIKNKNGGELILKCKDFRKIIIQIDSTNELNNVYNSIEYLNNLDDPRLMYPFFYRLEFEILENGWFIFELEDELKSIKSVTDNWRISYVNKNFSVCSFYPESVIVPNNVTDETLKIVSKFRCLGRFPVLSYFHKKNKASLMRSGQPMVGPGNKRCREDEKLINMILSNKKKGYIIETRTQNLAQLAFAKGGGFELEMHYPLWRRVHKPVERHVFLMESLSKLVEACNEIDSSVEKWLHNLETCGWLSHIKDILMCSCLVAQCIDQEGASVLVHGAEGMDSTLQVCSLAQIILSPSYRTIRGFQYLIEKEWINGGHPFYIRNSKTVFSFNSQQKNFKETSPIFLAFLDCVHQIYKQFPFSFEFNEFFLITIFKHSYSSQFGTFLTNCIKQRDEYNLIKNTVSLWSYMNVPTNKRKYINPAYEPNNNVIWPSVAPQSIKLWDSLFLRWIINQNSSDEINNTIEILKLNEEELKNQAKNLRKRLLKIVNLKD